MPVKKKSCFQITSVTQAQVAANNAADDTESLDDPDESRIEEISSDVFEVCQTEFEPAACDGSSLEETLNNVGESEAGHAHLARQLPSAPSSFNTGTPFRNVIPNSAPGVSPSLITGMSPAQTSALSGGLVQPVPQPSVGIASATTSQSAPTSSVTSTPTTGSCGSRFRVIKLDHGTGEPFRRGRWTCTEFYEKDPEGSVISRNLDTIRHNNTADSTTERDSGFGATAGSSIALSGLSGHGSDPAETSLTTSSHMVHPDVQQQQSYGIGQHHIITGAITHEPYPISNNNKPVTTPQQIQGTPHTAQPQTLLMPGMNGSPQTMHVQKLAGMPSAPQTQSVIYQTQPSQPQPTPPKQLPLGHQLSAQSSTIPGYQLEHNQKHLPVTTAQTHSGANLTVGQAVSQGPSPVPTPASGVQVLGAAGDIVVGAAVVPLPASQPASFPANAHLPQPTNGMVSTGGSMKTGPLHQQQQPQMGQYLSSGEAQGLPMAPNSVQNVPTASSSAAMPSVPASSIPTSVPVASSLPTQNTALSPSVGQQQPAHMSRNGTMASGAIVNHPTPSFGQGDENRRKSDIISQFPAVSGKDLSVKPLIPVSLQLTHPTVNSLFGIHIPIDGDEDGASGASVVAIDNKIEQAMDLVKSHLMYAVREEVEVLKEQIKELFERNSVLERENAVLKSLANSDQLSQLPVQSVAATSNSTPQKLPGGQAPGMKGHSQQAPSLEASKPISAPPPQPSVTSA